VPQKYFSVEDVATFVHHTGATTLPGDPPDLSRGRTVLCVHGAGDNGASFGALLERLGETHSPIAFDQPGHARSGSLDSLGSIPFVASFTRALQRTLGLSRPVLLGHSLGGAVALQIALDAPDSAEALVLVGAGARFELVAGMLDAARKVTEGKARRSFTRDQLSPASEMDAARKMWIENAKTDPRAEYGDLVALSEFDVTERLSEIQLPTLVVVGEDERPAFRAQADLLSGSIAGARLEVIAKAGHVVHIEQPDALADVVLDFLGGLS